MMQEGTAMKPVRDTFLVFGQPLIEQPEIDELVASLESGWLGTGPKTKQFEADFAAYKGLPHAAALNSATAGLHLSCLVLDLQPGDEIITTPLTFCATVNSILHSGATPVLADVDPLTWNLDPAEVERKITPRTRAIMPVHYAGRACEMDALMAIAQRHGLAVIEDCAHAIETEYHGRKAGTFGDFGVFSFYSTKNIVTGEGGMVVTRDEAKIDRIRVLGLHGMSRHAWQRFSDKGFKHYYVEEAGFKYNMMDLQAALGLHQLKRIDAYWKKREKVWKRYMEAFADLPVGLPAPVEPDTRHAYHLFQILIDEAKVGMSRDAFLDEMTRRKIGVGVHYLSMPEHPYYQRALGWSTDDFPHAYRIGQQTVSLPISARLSEQDVDDVIAAVRDILNA